MGGALERWPETRLDAPLPAFHRWRCVKTRKAAAQIRAALQKQYATGTRAFVMVIELGDDWSAYGNSRAWEWLQHH